MSEQKTLLSASNIKVLQDLDRKIIKAMADGDFVSQGANSVAVIQIIEVSLGDGIQLDDILRLLQLEPLVKGIISNAQKALENLRTLDRDRLTETGVAIYARAINFASLGPVSWWVVMGLATAGFALEQLDDIVGRIQDVRGVITSMSKRENIIDLITELDPNKLPEA